MKAKTKSNVSQVILTIVLTISGVLVLFPFLYSVSLSFQSFNAIYKVPPEFLPSIGKQLDIQVSYEALPDEDTLLQDAAAGLFGSYFDNRSNDIDRYTYTAVVNGTPVLYSSVHNMRLQLEAEFGAFLQAQISQKTILGKNRYLTAMNAVGYEYNPQGLDREITALTNQEEEIPLKVLDLFGRKYKFHASNIQAGITSSDVLTKLESYVYYFQLPQYMYKGYPFVAKYGFLAFLFNTVLTVVTALVCQITLPALTAYPMAVLMPKRLGNAVMLFFLVTMMVPFVCIMIPQLVLLKGMGMYDNYAVVLFPWLLPAPFYIFLYKGFFEKVPKSYFEAAEIDGAGAMYTFLHICLPLCKPIIAMIAIQSFISGWADFFWYFLSTKNISLWTLNLAIYNINTSAKTNFIMGLSVVVSTPVILLAIIFSKQIKQSVVGAGIKE